MDNSAKDLLRFQARKEVVGNYKRALNVLEDIRDEHYFLLEKLKKALPEQYHIIIDTVNYMDDNKFALLRKRTLDAGNDSARNIDEAIGKFKINFN